MSEVPRKVWIRGRFATLIASHSVSMSFFTARASPVTTGPRTALAIAWTASKSPGEEAGNPASMMSTLSASNCRAISIFCSLASFAPGTCSPSRSVVSKMKTFSAISCLLAVSGLRPAASALFPGKGKPPGRRSPGACDKNKNRGNLPVPRPVSAYSCPCSLRRRSGSYGSEVG